MVLIGWLEIVIFHRTNPLRREYSRTKLLGKGERVWKTEWRIKGKWTRTKRTSRSISNSITRNERSGVNKFNSTTSRCLCGRPWSKWPTSVEEEEDEDSAQPQGKRKRDKEERARREGKGKNVQSQRSESCVTGSVKGDLLTASRPINLRVSPVEIPL